MPDDTNPPADHLQPFSDLVGREFVELIFESAPRKVATRVGKALDHYTKALKLKGVDDEMGAIRCIAAEEELVVAIFKWLKLNTDAVPEHADFIRRFKNHQVKLAFCPVVSQFRFVLRDVLENGFSLTGLEGALPMKAAPVVADGKVMLRISVGAGKSTIDMNPLHVSITREGLDDDAIVDALFDDFRQLITDQNGMSVREFMSARADYRNQLLYASDAGYGAMEETLEVLIADAFLPTYRDLLWTLAILLGNKPAAKDWGLISQFIGLYRRALTDAKII